MAETLYVHGVPTGSFDWDPFTALTGGLAPDLPGFGSGDKEPAFHPSIPGYLGWLQAYVAEQGLGSFNLVVHDWGAVGLALAQAMPERIERLVVIDAVPFLPGYRWHKVARAWRRPLIGEMAMGFTFKRTMERGLAAGQREPLPAEWIETVWSHFDHGTQRAILKLYRSSPPVELERAGSALGELRCPALVIWGENDPYIPPAFAQRYADALGGETEVRLLPGAGHWPWFDEPGVVNEVAAFLSP